MSFFYLSSRSLRFCLALIFKHLLSHTTGQIDAIFHVKPTSVREIKVYSQATTPNVIKETSLDPKSW